MSDRIKTASLAVIALAHVVIVAVVVLWAWTVFVSFGRGIDDSEDRVEVTTTVVDTSVHLVAQAGETKTFTLSPGVYQILGGSQEAPISMTSLNAPAGSTWNSFMHVVTIVDLDLWERAREYDGTFPGGPLEVEVASDQPWVVDILRVWCPDEIE